MQTQPVYNYLTWVKTSFGNNAYNSLASNLEFTRTLKLNDWQLYGSSRLGVYNADTTLTNITFTINGIDSNGNFEVNQIISQTNVSVNHYHMQHHLAHKQFELTNHLGNVLATVLDRKTNNTADVVTAQHYYPFGSVMSSYQAEEFGYRFGFNGQEKLDEIYGAGNLIDYGARVRDPRIGPWLSVDPLQQKYPSLSPYNYVANSPIMFVDPDGKRIKPTNQAAIDALNILLKANPKVDYKYDEVTGVYSLKGNLIDYENLKGDAATLVKVLSSVEIVEVTVTTTSQTNNDQTLQNNTDKKGTTVGDEKKIKTYTFNEELKDVEQILLNDTELKNDGEDALYRGADYVPNKKKPEEVINVTPTKSGDDWIYFDNKNTDRTTFKSPEVGGTDEQNTKGRVLINGTGKNDAQIGKTLLKAANEAIKTP